MQTLDHPPPVGWAMSNIAIDVMNKNLEKNSAILKGLVSKLDPDFQKQRTLYVAPLSRWRSHSWDGGEEFF